MMCAILSTSLLERCIVFFNAGKKALGTELVNCWLVSAYNPDCFVV